MQFVFIFPGIWNANKPYGRCLKDCPNKQTKKLDWITFPHSVAQAISDFARRCYKPYESLMSQRRKKKPSLMYSWLKNWWGPLRPRLQREAICVRSPRRVRWAPFGPRAHTNQPVTGQTVRNHSASAECQVLFL